ncbi:MAG: HesA/MoeB/ThiF family protein, partial [Candidatus Bathyarchaeota archaeon]|nr:HesA/MoeB/ThiF family protein [Candidatus Bathyarchaeota archaeon]
LKLKGSRVCLMGVGGLGSPAALQLAAMGVGFLRIVDRDVVESTNLHRQHLYGVDEVGYPKVEAAAKRLRKLNPFITVEPLAVSVNENTVDDLIKDVDIVVDGLDSMAARYAVNRACIKLGVPYVFGAAITTTGNLSTIVPGKTACLECFYGNLDDKKLPKCGVVGVHPSVVNIIASLEVSEAIRILTGREPLLVNKLLYFDLEELEFNEVQLGNVKTCPVCGQHPSVEVNEHELVEEICGRNGKKVFVIVPPKPLDVDLTDLKKNLVNKGFTLNIEGELGLTFTKKDVKASVLKSGVLILSGFKQKSGALKFFEELIGTCY